MDRFKIAGLMILAFALAVINVSYAVEQQAKASTPDWSMNATIIEACSCPMFCQCYFNTKPAAHHGDHGEGDHYCRFNNAFKVNKGSYGTIKLDGAKFWVAGDLGDDFGDGETDWAVVTFDKAMTKEQREAIGVILGHLYPVKWKSLSTAEGEMMWMANKDEAHAMLDGGKTAEVVLKRYPGHGDQPVVIKNLKYFNEKSNDGFIMMPNTVETYRMGDKPFEFKGTNGFMITVSIDSKM